MNSIEVRRSADRFVTTTDWLVSRHAFSFGQHYDPDDVGHGLLVVCNEDVLAPDGGFDSHPHREMEIVSWVLEGALAHEDSAGHRSVTRPGVVQRMSAGRGVVHSERNAGPGPVHYVQMWLTPDETGTEPGYDQLDVADRLDRPELTTLASGRPEDVAAGALRLRNRAAALHAVRLGQGETVEVPEAPFRFLLVTRGTVELGGVGDLYEGDSVRCRDAGPVQVTGRSAEQAEVLVWEMHAPL